MQQRSYGILDGNCPINWDHPLNRGLAAELSVPPLAGWRGGGILRDLVRGAKVAHDGTLSAAVSTLPLWQPTSRKGGYGQLTFDGASAYVSNMPIVPPTAAMMLACWFRTTSVSTFLIGWNNLATGTAGTNDRDLYLDASGHLLWYVFTGSQITITSTKTYNDGAWHFACGVIDTQIRLYVDGVADGTPNTGTGGFNGYSSPFLVLGRGVTSGGTALFLNGSLDETLLLGRGPGAAEVMALYQESRLGNPERWRWLSPTTWFLPVAAATFVGDDSDGMTFTSRTYW